MTMEAIVVFSGGQDSTTVLCKAIKELGADRVAALTFDYGQRHRTEVDAAREIAAALGVEHEVVEIDALRRLAPSAQTRPGIDVAPAGGLGNLPTTFTPSRNLTFIALASAYAIGRGARKLYLGVCQTDYSGYPDCRRVFIDEMEKAVALGNGLEKFEIVTPLMELTKAQTVKLAADLGAIDILEHTITCYHGQRPGCGKCPACELRAKGFAEAGIADPATRT